MRDLADRGTSGSIDEEGGGRGGKGQVVAHGEMRMRVLCFDFFREECVCAVGGLVGLDGLDYSRGLLVEASLVSPLDANGQSDFRDCSHTSRGVKSGDLIPKSLMVRLPIPIRPDHCIKSLISEE